VLTITERTGCCTPYGEREKKNPTNKKREMNNMADKKKIVKSPASAKRAIATRWDSDRERLNRKRSELKRGFDDWMETREPLADVTDKGTQYVIHVELPGFDKDDVDVELNKDVLTLNAERNAESEEQSTTYLWQERAYASFSRTIFFPEEVEPSKAEATMDKGILTLTVPKLTQRPEERMTKLKLK